MTKGQKMLEPETIHRNVNGGWLRPAVFGAMDGLVSNDSKPAGRYFSAISKPHETFVGLPNNS